MTRTSAELLVDCLAAEGVECVFGLPGEELAEVMAALADSEITFVPVRHEQGAAFMADVHGRLTGDAGVCLSTLGPGATNLLTGVADAQLDKSPLVAITGQGARGRLHQESHQRLDIVNTYRSIVKWNAQLDDPGIVAEAVRKAFKRAEWEKPGATHLELPEDVAAAPAEGEPLAPAETTARAEPDDEAVGEAVARLRGADRPLVLAGNGVVRAGAADRLRSLVAGANLPVVSTYMAKGAVSDRSERSLMALGSGPEASNGGAVADADLVIAVGYDVAEHDPAAWNSGGEKTVVHVDSEPAEVYEHYTPAVELVGDIGAGVRALDDALDHRWPAWWGSARERIREAATERPDEGDPFTVEGSLPLLRDAMADEDVLLSDVGSHKMAIARRFPVVEPNTCLVSNGLASMGIAVPGAVAADLAVDGNVVVGTGDGGFLMNAAELNTATRVDASFTVVLFNDDEYRLITEEFEEAVGEAHGTRLTNPDFEGFAESFGLTAHRPTTWDDLAAALDEAVGSDELTLVEVALDRPTA